MKIPSIYILCLFISWCLSACSLFNSNNSTTQLDALKPMHYVFNQMPEDADEIYKQGWQDGCNSGISTFSNDFYKAFYHYQNRPELMHRTNYARAWETAFHYCRASTLGVLKESNMRATRPQDHPIQLQGLDDWINGFGPQMFQNWWQKEP